MNHVEGHEELISCPTCKVRGAESYCRKTCFCVVDPACTPQAQQNHWEDQFQILGALPQVWRENFKTVEEVISFNNENGNTL